MALSEKNTDKKRGNPFWHKGISGNVAGRPKVLNKDKKTNKEIRSAELLALTRKLKPHVSKAIMAAVNILENKEAMDSSKLKASALIIATYRELIKDTFHKDYDLDEGEEIQQNNAPIFSLKVISKEDEIVD